MSEGVRIPSGGLFYGAEVDKSFTGVVGLGIIGSAGTGAGIASLGARGGAGDGFWCGLGSFSVSRFLGFLGLPGAFLVAVRSSRSWGIGASLVGFRGGCGVFLLLFGDETAEVL